MHPRTTTAKTLAALGMESIPGPHPVVPALVRDTDRAREMVCIL